MLRYFTVYDTFYPLVLLEESRLIIQVIRSDLIMCAKFHVNIVIVVKTHISLTVTNENLIVAAEKKSTDFILQRRFICIKCYGDLMLNLVLKRFAILFWKVSF